MSHETYKITSPLMGTFEDEDPVMKNQELIEIEIV